MDMGTVLFKMVFQGLFYLVLLEEVLQLSGLAISSILSVVECICFSIMLHNKTQSRSVTIH